MDKGTTMSREFYVVSPHRAFALILFNDHLFIARFKNESFDRWDVSFGTDRSWSMGFYCFGFLFERQAIWPHLGQFGATAFEGRPEYEMFRGAAIVMVPTWVPMVLLSIAPAFALRRALQRRRIPPGHC